MFTSALSTKEREKRMFSWWVKVSAKFAFAFVVRKWNFSRFNRFPCRWRSDFVQLGVFKTVREHVLRDGGGSGAWKLADDETMLEPALILIAFYLFTPSLFNSFANILINWRMPNVILVKQLNALLVQSAVDKITRISFAEIYSHVWKENDNKSLPQVVNGNWVFSESADEFDFWLLEFRNPLGIISRHFRAVPIKQSINFLFFFRKSCFLYFMRLFLNFLSGCRLKTFLKGFWKSRLRKEANTLWRRKCSKFNRVCG